MADIVSYEVYVYQDGDWDLLARYPSNQRATAIDYAKSIEKANNRPTKVIREGYDLSTKSFRDSLVYLSDLSKFRGKRNLNFTQKAESTKKAASPQAQTMGNILENITKLFLALLFSIVISGILTTAVLHAADSFNLLPRNISQQFILSIFTFFFLLISIPSAASWVNWNIFLQDEKPSHSQKTDTKSEDETNKFSVEDLYRMSTDRNDEEENKQKLPFFTSILYDFLDSLNILMGRQPILRQTKDKNQKNKQIANQAYPQPLPIESDVAEEEEEEEEEPEEQNDQKETEPDLDALPPETFSQQQEKTSAFEEEKDDTPVVIPPDLEKSYMKMATFLSLVLRTLQNKNTAFNTYIRFGLELFLAGACESLCQKERLSKKDNKLILSKVLTLLGRPASLASVFYQKMDEYILEPKYLPMIEYGSEGMRTYLANPSSPESITFISSAIENWQNPNQKEKPSSGICTVMFTDMVSSTHITQMLGDNMAQQLVRNHNTIVRNALKACGGTEVKHTGDGIMASFLWASNAVDAAIEIQENVAKYNRHSPTVPLEIRIGCMC